MSVKKFLPGCKSFNNISSFKNMESSESFSKEVLGKKDKYVKTGEDLVIAGFVPFSTVDWVGNISCVLFLQGCPWRCVYCHNHDILDPKAPSKVSFSDVVKMLKKRVGLIDGVVFSGGEATMQDDLIPAIKIVKSMGFKVGLHTAGAYPKKLSNLLKYIDWVGIDIKALPEDYQEIIGRPNGGYKAYESLKVVLQSHVDYEVRLTVFPNSVTSGKGVEIAQKCFDMGVRNFALQQAREQGSPTGFIAQKQGWDKDFISLGNKINTLGFESFELRTI